MRFDERNVVLTGVGREGQVGEAVAQAFADAGARLFLIDRRESQANERVRGLGSSAARAEGFGTDLTDFSAVSAVASEIGARTGGQVDALVHLAGGFASSGPLGDSDTAVWTQQIAINATTAYVTARAFLPLLRGARGSLVFFASESVLPGARTAGVAAYAAAKTAVVSLMQSIAQEEASAGVRANAVAPTAIRTASNEAAMAAKTAFVSREDVARVVLWLCSEEARVVNGQVIRVR